MTEYDLSSETEYDESSEMEKINQHRRIESEMLCDEGRPVLEIIKHFDNDYSPLEEEFRQKAGFELLSDPYESSRHEINITKKCSIVIPAYNNSERLCQCLRAIQASSFNVKFPQLLEVVVIDDGSPTENIADSVESFGLSDLNIKVFRQSNGRAAKARYSGALNSTGDIVIVTDPDIVYAPTMIEEYMKRHEILNNLVMFGFRENIDSTDGRLSRENIDKGSLDGLSLNIGDDPRVAKDGMADCDWLKKSGHNQQLPIDAEDERFDWTIYKIAWGMSVSASREDLIKTYAGYDERYVGYGAEDEDMTARLIALGNYIIPNTGGFCFHQRHPSADNPEKKQNNINVLTENLNSKLKKQPVESAATTDATLVFELRNDRNEAKENAPVKPIENHYSEAITLLSMGEYQKSLGFFDKSEAKTQSGADWINFKKAEANVALGDSISLSEALKLLNQTGQRLDENPEYLLLSARLNCILGNYDQSKRLFIEAIRFDRDNSITGEYQRDANDDHKSGAVLLRAGKYHQAVIFLTAALNKADDDRLVFWIKVDLATSLIHLKNSNRAISILKECAEIDPRNTWIYSSLGLAREAKNDHRNAVIAYKYALKLDSSNNDAKLGLQRLGQQV